MDDPFDNDISHGESLAVLERKPKTARPPMYKVVLLNDDFTPMEFVVIILKHVFRKAHEEAVKLMLTVHTQGSAICGIYTKDVAETKTEETLHLARAHHYPLQCTVEKE